MLALGVMKRQTPAMTVLDLPHVKFGVPFTEFKQQIRQYVYFTFFFFFYSFCQAGPLTGGAGWMKLTVSRLRRSYTFAPYIMK